MVALSILRPPIFTGKLTVMPFQARGSSESVTLRPACPWVHVASGDGQGGVHWQPVTVDFPNPNVELKVKRKAALSNKGSTSLVQGTLRLDSRKHLSRYFKFSVPFISRPWLGARACAASHEQTICSASGVKLFLQVCGHGKGRRDRDRYRQNLNILLVY